MSPVFEPVKNGKRVLNEVLATLSHHGAVQIRWSLFGYYGDLHDCE